MNVFITGATGYVGRAVLAAVQREGHQATILQQAGSRRQLSAPDVRVVTGSITDPDSLRGTMDGADAVIHLVGIIREVPRKGITMDRIHRQGTENVLAEAKRAGVRRFLHMSALGARAGAVSGYHRSKWAAEEAVRGSGLEWTIFRPSVVFGKGGPGPEFVGQLADLVRTAPICPVIGDGSAPLQPVSVQTVADAFAAALVTPASAGKVYEVGGPAVVTYGEILQRIAAALDKRLRTVHIPMGLMGALMPVLQHAPGFPLTMDQFAMLREGNACTDAQSLYRDLGLTPIPFHVVWNGQPGR